MIFSLEIYIIYIFLPILANARVVFNENWTKQDYRVY